MTITSPELEEQAPQPAIASQLDTLIEQLRNAAPHKRERVISTIVELLWSHYRNWAPKFCRSNGDTSLNHREDVIAVVAERTVTVLRETAEGEDHKDVRNWYSYLYAAGRFAVHHYFNSPSVTPASGMTALLRKQRHIGTVRSTLRSKLGREPEPQEIVEEANADMRRRRSNPEKQGVLVDLSDLEVIVPTVDIADHDGAVDDESDAVLAPVEGRELVRLIVDAAFQISSDLGAAADVWIGSMYADPPFLGGSSDIAAALDVSTVKAGRLLSTCRDLAKDLCKRRFGIDFAI